MCVALLPLFGSSRLVVLLGCPWDSSGNCEKEVKIVSWLGFFGIVILLYLYIDFTLLGLCFEQRLNEEDYLCTACLAF